MVKMLVVPVIGIGASAGGLDALKEFFSAMPVDSGMAFVIVQHLDPTHESRMAEILSKSTTMKVVQAEDGMPVQPNTVFTNPPGRVLGIHEGLLVLGKPTGGAHVEAAIDHFLTSLAGDQGQRAICVILSGSSGADGPQGVRAIRNAGGMCIVQDPGTAEFAQMPQAVVNTGLADYLLSPGEMPKALLKFARHTQVPAASGDLEAILNLLFKSTESDYRHYKKTTVVRRIHRRMGLLQVKSMGEYAKVLKEDSNELTQLARDMLIGVSSFFRDADAFEELRTKVIVPLVGAKEDNAPLRVWIPGCATGEEAYSIAMLLLEERSAVGKACAIHVFATDVDLQALQTARAGTYFQNITKDISSERLGKFFVKQGQTYQVIKQLREAVVFSRQNILTDPPFSRMDLISCRNVFIYLEPEAQKKVLSAFSFALNVGGYLLLGKSEGINGMENIFEPVSKPNRIYRLTRSTRQVNGKFPLYSGSSPQRVIERERAGTESSLLAQANLEAILRHFDASVVLIEPGGRILYLHGQTEKYLGHPKGPANFNILEMTRGIFSAKLRRVIDKAVREGETVNLPQITLSREGAPVDLTVIPMAERTIGEGRLLAIIFQDTTSSPLVTRAVVPSQEEPLVSQIEAEIQSLRRELQSNAEVYDLANEKLKATNEEMMSMNEELQSANEELESSKEEMQSLNEELTTVNSQLGDKVDELIATTNDLDNLLKATEIATVFLDEQLRIKQFTPRATEMLNLIESDKGRPVSHITQNFTGIDLVADAENVLKNLTPLEKEVQSHKGQWYTLRILPYRTLDNRIEGTVVTFSDVTRLKETESKLRYEKTYAQGIVETVRESLVVLDDQLKLLSANSAFYETFQVQAEECTGLLFYDLGDRQWNIPHLRNALHAVSELGQKLTDFEVEHNFPGIGLRTMLLNARRIEATEILPHRILLAIEDITDRKRTEAELIRSNNDLEQFAYIASHDLLEPLRHVNSFMKLLQEKYKGKLDEQADKYINYAADGALRMSVLINDLLEYSRVGATETQSGTVSCQETLDKALANLGAAISETGAHLTQDLLPSLVANGGELTRLFQNLIGNALKFRREGVIPEIHVGAKREGNEWMFWVRDNGIGIPSEEFERIFMLFQRLHSLREYSGTGIGLAICKKIVDRHGGRIWLESEEGKGSTFYFTLPAGGAEL